MIAPTSPRWDLPEGATFANLTFTGETFREKRHWFLRCVCACGQQANVRADRWGKNASCNACAVLARAATNTKHGLAAKPEYRSWGAMIARCTDPRATGWEDYGGRGITVCPEWLDVTVFVRDMGPRPAGTTLDRINNSEGYKPGNCRWATPKVQANNRRLPRAAERCRKDLHDLTPDNQYFNKTTGTRTCKQCAKERAAAQYEKRKAAAQDASVPQLDAPAAKP